MTHILPPDKLREILFDDYEHAPDWFHDGQSTDEEAMVDLHWTMGRLQQLAADALREARHKDGERYKRQLEDVIASQRDALVAELESIRLIAYHWTSSLATPPAEVISDAIAQLTTVPDLPSEQETLREQGQITQPNIFPKGGLVDSITKIDGFDRPSPEQRSEAAPEGGKDE